MSGSGERFSVEILPSAMTDVICGKFFYDSIEQGVGERFRNYIVEQIDSLGDNAGIDPVRLGYYCRIANRFHQNIYYKIDGNVVTVWRVLDQRFDPKRIHAALAGGN